MLAVEMSNHVALYVQLSGAYVNAKQVKSLCLCRVVCRCQQDTGSILLAPMHRI